MAVRGTVVINGYQLRVYYLLYSAYLTQAHTILSMQRLFTALFMSCVCVGKGEIFFKFINEFMHG